MFCALVDKFKRTLSNSSCQACQSQVHYYFLHDPYVSFVQRFTIYYQLFWISCAVIMFVLRVTWKWYKIQHLFGIYIILKGNNTMIFAIKRFRLSKFLSDSFIVTFIIFTNSFTLHLYLLFNFPLYLLFVILIHVNVHLPFTRCSS